MSFIKRYREENEECEFIGLFDPPGGHCKECETHHVARIRWDVLTAVLRLCPNCHDWGHANDAEFIVWCLWKKFKKGELDMEFLEKKKRGKSLRSYLVPHDHYREITNDMIYELLREVG